jgi:hypothetical protein
MRSPAIARTRELLEQWRQDHRHEPPLNTGDQMIRNVADRFDLIKTLRGTYFYRGFCYKVAATERGRRIAGILHAQECRLTGAGVVLSTGLRMIARKAVA